MFVDERLIQITKSDSPQFLLEEEMFNIYQGAKKENGIDFDTAVTYSVLWAMALIEEKLDENFESSLTDTVMIMDALNLDLDLLPCFANDAVPSGMIWKNVHPSFVRPDAQKLAEILKCEAREAAKGADKSSIYYSGDLSFIDTLHAFAEALHPQKNFFELMGVVQA